MNASDAINFVRRDLKAARQQGLLFVEIKALDIYLTDLGERADQAATETALDAQMRLAGAQLQHATLLEFTREVHESAKGALNTAILVNGGAAVAMLGYLGSEGVHGAPGLVRDAMAWFAAGVLFGTVAYATRYFSGSAFARGRSNRSKWFDRATVATWLASIGCFGLGVLQAYQAF